MNIIQYPTAWYKIILVSVFQIFFLAGISARDKLKIKIGGALRFNYVLSSWKEGQQKRGGDFGYDVFRINPEVCYKGVSLNAEYRFYSNAFGGGMLKQGWFQFKINKKDKIQIGLTQVPFGITQYNSHNWFFSINYYTGLEDDHDMGIKYENHGEKVDFYIAYFKNAEELAFGNNSDLSSSRYAYDIASKDADGDGSLDFRNKEIHQLNGKIIYKICRDKTKHKVGASLQYGGLFNLDTENSGHHLGLALHYELAAKRYDIKAQLTYYDINPNQPNDETDDIVAMTAYGAPYFVASSAFTYTLGVGYDFCVEWGPISKLNVYNDFGYMNKTIEEFEDTIMNVLGVLVTAGPLQTYFDIAAGKNMPWLNPDYDNSLAEGSTLSEAWEVRFNINFGYYF